MRWVLAALAVLVLCAPAAAATPEVDARAYLVENAQTGDVLLARHAHDRLPIASLTKLMTAIGATSMLRPSATVVVDPEAAGVTGSTIRLRAGEHILVRDLLAGALIQSANDAAVALGEQMEKQAGVAISELMNTWAAGIGLKDTHFVRPDGLDVPGHYSSAYDVTKLAIVAMRVPLIRRLVRRESATIAGGRTLHTWNDLLGEFPGVFGVKTGHTSSAGWSQVAAVRGNGVTLYVTVLGSPSRSTRNGDLEELIAWGLSRYALVALAPPDRVYGRVPVNWDREAVPVVAARPVRRAVRIGRPLIERVVLPSRLELPVHRGQVVGQLRIYDGKRVIGRAPLVAAEDRDEPGVLDRSAWYAGRAIDHIGGWFT